MNLRNLWKVFFDQDGILKWTTIPPNHLTSPEINENCIPLKPGVTSYAADRISEIRDTFDLCLPSTMKSEIIRFSNLQGDAVFADFHPIDETEFDAFLGLLILIGIYRSYGESLNSLWDEFHGRPLLRAVMSLERFCNISRVLTFTDRSSRKSLNRTDKLAPIRQFYQKWTENLKVLYVPKQNITVGEQLIPFRGICPFKVYMPRNPAKYGLKAWIAADSATGFCLQFQMYLPETASSPEPSQNQREQVVLDLVSEYRDRNITTDSCFTSHKLALELLKRKITLVGAVRNNKRFLPLQGPAKQIRKLPLYSSQFFFHDMETVVQYVPKKHRLVSLLSTLHHDSQVLTEHPKQLPQILEYYNTTKGGLDRMNRMIRTYSCKRKTNRWPIALFYNFLDISALNAFVMWTEVRPNWQRNKLLKRRTFLENLGDSLVRPCILKRNHIPRAEASALLVRKIQNEDETSSTATSAPAKRLCASKRKRCKLCPSRKEKKTNVECLVCQKSVCPEHRHTVSISNTYCLEHTP